MFLRPAFLFLTLLAALSLSTGCGMIPGLGGGEAGAGEIGLIDFGGDPEQPAGPDLETAEEAVARALYIDPELLIEIRFLYHFQVRLERLRRVIRDLNAALEHSAPVDVDLDWVVEVHEVTRESDDYFQVLTSMQIPESQRERYGYLQIGMLETVQVAGYGADRLLAASVVVGPSGRSLLNMNAEETDRFETLLREAEFFLSNAQGRIDGEIEEVGRVVGSLGLR